nr:MAG TPA: hypothetical protein [Caudoviricetes sp.]
MFTTLRLLTGRSNRVSSGQMVLYIYIYIIIYINIYIRFSDSKPVVSEKKNQWFIIFSKCTLVCRQCS